MLPQDFSFIGGAAQPYRPGHNWRIRDRLPRAKWRKKPKWGDFGDDQVMAERAARVAAWRAFYENAMRLADSGGRDKEGRDAVC